MRWLAALATSSIFWNPTACLSDTIKGELVAIQGRVGIVWIRGEACGSTRMCEGVLYANADIRMADGSIRRLPRLVLAHPETTDCLHADPYWAMQAVAERFSSKSTGSIMGHPYAAIRVGALTASAIDLTAATDKRIGFSASGAGYIGEISMTVTFDVPVPEERHLQSFCNDRIDGTDLISEKHLNFKGPLKEVATRTD